MQSELRDGRHEATVVNWRCEQLVRSGFPRGLAARLAHDCRLDLHALIELAEHGCPPELAVQILAPLDMAEEGA